MLIANGVPLLLVHLLLFMLLSGNRVLLFLPLQLLLFELFGGFVGPNAFANLQTLPELRGIRRVANPLWK